MCVSTDKRGWLVCMTSSISKRCWRVYDCEAMFLARSSRGVDDRDKIGDTVSMEYQASENALGEALRYVKMSGIFYCPSELSEPWGLELPPMANCVWFHVVTHGVANVEVNGDVRTAHPGDLILVPHGTGHRAWGTQPAPTPDVFTLPHDYYSDQYALLRHGGGGERTHVVCGGIRFDHPAATHLVDSLPPIIHIEASQTTRADWMRATLELMAEETRHVRPGSEVVISRLCDIVVMQAIRSWIERDPAAQTGWLGALRDERVGAAIASIHAAPDRDWTVASLADEVAMSRSAFAARFTELVGEPAMAYVTRWRMHVAFELLRAGETTVAAAAAQVGYDSEAAFSRAFKRVTGITPSSARTATELAWAVPQPQ
ncbi:Transcriptional regulator, AraC family [hydrothermal vent metagenome]|uniref:Transcriptional regulator, AraC family n=1 Tax=hydrothermal vent metagenome TaxID=652676 RepID=A0A3B0TGZ6_9ZZZZ